MSLRGFWIRHRFEIAAVVGLWLIAALVFKLLTDGLATPLRPVDEFLYWHIADSFASGDGLRWRGERIQLNSPLYVWLISTAFWGGRSVASAYHFVLAINAVAMTAVVVPAYVLARQFVAAPAAFVAALLAVAVPTMSYVGMIGTEALAYPVVTGALFAVVMAVQQPTRTRWGVALLTVVVAGLVRAQFGVLLIVYPIAIALAACLRPPGERRSGLVEHREPLIATGGVLLAIGLVFVLGPHGALGQYQGLLDFSFPSPVELAAWIKDFVADAFLLVAVVPAVAFLALLIDPTTRRDPRLIPLLAVTASAAGLLILQTAWFSAASPVDFRKNQQFYERYIFYIAPLLFTAFVVFLTRGSRKPAMIAAAISVVAVLILDPHLVLAPFSYDSWSLTLLGEWLDGAQSRQNLVGPLLAGVALLLGVVATACVAGLSWSHRARYLAVGLVVVLLLGTQVRAWDRATENSQASLAAYTAGGPTDLIDRFSSRPAAVIATRDVIPEIWFQTEFWNRNVTTVFSPPSCALDWDSDGKIIGTGCAQPLPSVFYSRSTLVAFTFANIVRRERPSPGATLTEVRGPAALVAVLKGRNPTDGTVRGGVTVSAFGWEPARLTLRFARGQSVVVTASGKRIQSDRGSVTVDLLADSSETPITIGHSNGSTAPVAVENITLRAGDRKPISII